MDGSRSLMRWAEALVLHVGYQLLIACSELASKWWLDNLLRRFSSCFLAQDVSRDL